MVIGIDLGTTYSAAAFVNAQGNAEIIPNRQGNRTTPSVFFEDSDGKIIIGEIAKDNMDMYPKQVVSGAKNAMGDSTMRYKLASGNEYRPEEISAYIVKKIVQDAQDYCGEKITDVVITVPAYFKDNQRTATHDAAKIAGVNMIACINEPTAAILSYTEKNDKKEGIFMIYDLGGGTFDVSIVKVAPGTDCEYDVLSSEGVKNTGGYFFDKQIVKHVCKIINEKHQIDLELPEFEEEYQELVKKAETAKIQLSTMSKTTIPVKVQKVRENIEITREEFESMISKMFRKTCVKMDTAIRNAGIQKEDVDVVLLIGGSSRIPCIEEGVKAHMGKAPVKDVNPDEVVAMGAALYANLRSNNTTRKIFRDANSHAVGFIGIAEVIENNIVTKKKVNKVVIPKNSKLPAEGKVPARTVVDNQEVFMLDITEGEYEDIEAVSKLATIRINLPEGMKKNTNLEIKFELNEEQLLHVYVNIPSLKWEFEQELERVDNLSAEEISTMVEIANAKELN